MKWCIFYTLTFLAICLFTASLRQASSSDHLDMIFHLSSSQWSTYSRCKGTSRLIGMWLISMSFNMNCSLLHGWSHPKTWIDIFHICLVFLMFPNSCKSFIFCAAEQDEVCILNLRKSNYIFLRRGGSCGSHHTHHLPRCHPQIWHFWVFDDNGRCWCQLNTKRDHLCVYMLVRVLTEKPTRMGSGLRRTGTVNFFLGGARRCCWLIQFGCGDLSGWLLKRILCRPIEEERIAKQVRLFYSIIWKGIKRNLKVMQE